MLDSLHRRRRGRHLARPLSVLSGGRVGGAPGAEAPDVADAGAAPARADELERQLAALEQREAYNASVEAQLLEREQRAAAALAWDPARHELPERPLVVGPAARALMALLDDSELAAAQALAVEAGAPLDAQPEPHRTYRLLSIATQLPTVREKTGLRSDVAPDDVHAMDRTPGGAFDVADLVLGALERAGAVLPDGAAALDFGSSSGRVVRPLAAARPDVVWHGCDPNGAAIAWAQRNLPGIDFVASPQEPPLPYADGSFDLAYAISIWSHFDERAALRWLAEMHRVLRPGGLLLLTAAGLHNVAILPQWDVPEHYIRACAEALNRRGFWFYDSFGDDGDWGVKHPEWGSGYMTPEWLLARALPDWSVRLYEPGALQGVQDVYLLERR